MHSSPLKVDLREPVSRTLSITLLDISIRATMKQVRMAGSKVTFLRRHCSVFVLCRRLAEGPGPFNSRNPALWEIDGRARAETRVRASGYRTPPLRPALCRRRW
jgi:hypothetical protein